MSKILCADDGGKSLVRNDVHTCSMCNVFAQVPFVHKGACMHVCMYACASTGCQFR